MKTKSWTQWKQALMGASICPVMIPILLMPSIAGLTVPALAQPATQNNTPPTTRNSVTLSELPAASLDTQAQLNIAAEATKNAKFVEALEAAARALQMAQGAKDLAGQARAENLRASILGILNRPAEAVDARKREVELWNQLAALLYSKNAIDAIKTVYLYVLNLNSEIAPDSLYVAVSFNNLGALARRQGNLMEAKVYHERALALREKLSPDSIDVAISLNNLGNLAADQNDFQKARNYYLRALPMLEAHAANPLIVANVLTSLGNVTYNFGSLTDAKGYYKRALIVREKSTPTSLAVAVSLNNLGIVAKDQGNLAEAKLYHERSLAIRQTLSPDSLDVAASYINLGNVSYVQGDLEGARSYLMRALEILEVKEPQSLLTAKNLNNLGNAAKDQGNMTEAKAYYERALAIKTKLMPESLDVATSLYNLGNIARSQGSLDEAKNYYERSLLLRETLAPSSSAVADSLQGLGNIAMSQDRVSQAENLYKRSLTIREALAPGSFDVAVSLNNLGVVAAEQGQTTEAVTLAKRAWEIVLGQSLDVSGDIAGQAFTTSTHDFATVLVDMQVNTGKVNEAFLTLEQGRAQSLQRLLMDHRLLTSKPVLASSGSISKSAVLVWDAYQDAARAQNSTMQALTDAATAQRKAQTALDQQPTSAIAQAERTRTRAAFQVAQENVTRARLATEARYAELKRAVSGDFFTDALPTTEARRSLPSNALFAAFSIGEKESVLFLLRSTGSVKAYKIKATQKELAAQAAALRDAVANPKTPLVIATTAGRKLFTTLFPAGAAQAEVRHAARLILSPDDVLWNVPFSALVLDGSQSRDKLPQWLGTNKKLTLTPSLTVLARVCKQPRTAIKKLGTQRVRTSAPTALVVGDPLFARSQKAEPVPASIAATIQRQYLWTDDQPPAPLPGTRDEARRVATLYGTTPPLFGAEATEATVRQRLAQGVDVLHLATHGVLRRDVPLASGILLAAPVQNTDDSTNDGALQTWEIPGLDLSRTELAVLSACETARGTRKPGEGLIGLTRALQAAGCRSVIASQWPVSDKATTGLMTAFHQGLRAGMDKDEALRLAMAKTARLPASRHPYFWAAFLLTGDMSNGGLGNHSRPMRVPHR